MRQEDGRQADASISIRRDARNPGRIIFNRELTQEEAEQWLWPGDYSPPAGTLRPDPQERAGPDRRQRSYLLDMHEAGALASLNEEAQRLFPAPEPIRGEGPPVADWVPAELVEAVRQFRATGREIPGRYRVVEQAAPSGPTARSGFIRPATGPERGLWPSAAGTVLYWAPRVGRAPQFWLLYPEDAGFYVEAANASPDQARLMSLGFRRLNEGMQTHVLHEGLSIEEAQRRVLLETAIELVQTILGAVEAVWPARIPELLPSVPEGAAARAGEEETAIDEGAGPAEAEAAPGNVSPGTGRTRPGLGPEVVPPRSGQTRVGPGPAVVPPRGGQTSQGLGPVGEELGQARGQPGQPPSRALPPALAGAPTEVSLDEVISSARSDPRSVVPTQGRDFHAYLWWSSNAEARMGYVPDLPPAQWPRLPRGPLAFRLGDRLYVDAEALATQGGETWDQLVAHLPGLRAQVRGRGQAGAGAVPAPAGTEGRAREAAGVAPTGVLLRPPPHGIRVQALTPAQVRRILEHGGAPWNVSMNEAAYVEIWEALGGRGHPPEAGFVIWSAEGTEPRLQVAPDFEF